MSDTGKAAHGMASKLVGGLIKLDPLKGEYRTLDGRVFITMHEIHAARSKAAVEQLIENRIQTMGLTRQPEDVDEDEGEAVFANSDSSKGVRCLTDGERFFSINHPERAIVSLPFGDFALYRKVDGKNEGNRKGTGDHETAFRWLNGEPECELEIIKMVTTDGNEPLS